MDSIEQRKAEEAKRILSAFETKTWSEIKSEDSWTIFKVMAEFVTGFEKMGQIGPCVSIFGSSRTKSENPYYKIAVEIASKLVQNGYGVITGAGPGIMEAGNKGAFEQGGKSVGLHIQLPFEQNSNVYVDADKLIAFDYFFVRKVIFMRYSQGFIVMPGGMGTLDELFEALTLIQTDKVGRFPVVLVGKSFWGGLVDWIREMVLEKEENISPEDMKLISLVDTPDEAVAVINEFYKKYLLKPNF